MCFYFTLEFLVLWDLFSVFVGIKTCPYWTCYECVQFQIEIRKISCCGSRFPDKAKFGPFTLLFFRGRQRSVPSIITHVHSYCFASQTCCFVKFLLPLPSRKVPIRWTGFVTNCICSWQGNKHDFLACGAFVKTGSACIFSWISTAEGHAGARFSKAPETFRARKPFLVHMFFKM